MSNFEFFETSWVNAHAGNLVGDVHILTGDADVEVTLGTAHEMVANPAILCGKTLAVYQYLPDEGYVPVHTSFQVASVDVLSDTIVLNGTVGDIAYVHVLSEHDQLQNNDGTMAWGIQEGKFIRLWEMTE